MRHATGSIRRQEKESQKFAVSARESASPDGGRDSCFAGYGMAIVGKGVAPIQYSNVGPRDAQNRDNAKLEASGC